MFLIKRFRSEKEPESSFHSKVEWIFVCFWSTGQSGFPWFWVKRRNCGKPQKNVSVTWTALSEQIIKCYLCYQREFANRNTRKNIESFSLTSAPWAVMKIEWTIGNASGIFLGKTNLFLCNHSSPANLVPAEIKRATGHLPPARVELIGWLWSQRAMK